jgi:2-hydroxychromene-2-carboxylate isomerase
MHTVEVWIEYASTYSYLTVARIGPLADRRGLALQWQPFWLAPVRDAQGMGSPFEPFPNKLAYMWRDLERRARRLGIPYQQPSAYPVNALLTVRVALVAAREGWCRPFTEAVFALHWTRGILIGSEENLGEALRSLGKDPGAVIAQAQSAANKEALKAQTTRAVALGIFGSPSFVVGDELFWGDDRLEEALEWAARP